MYRLTYLMSLGMLSVTKTAIGDILKAPGNAMAIVIGGADEVELAQTVSSTLFLKRRFGFVKLAIEGGASLVPVYAFGENDVYPLNIPPTWVQPLLDLVKKMIGLMPPWV